MSCVARCSIAGPASGPHRPGSADRGPTRRTQPRQADTPPPGALSPRNANYDIDVRLDHATRTLTGTAIIRWRNIGQAPTDSLRLHLYWNGWRNTASTWMREARAGRGRRRPARGQSDWSYINVTALALANADGTAGLDLMPGFAFVQPDDGNPEDRTLAAVALAGGRWRPAARWRCASRGQRASRARSRAPARSATTTSSRTGSRRSPSSKDDRWMAHQFHANTEFFSDYGRYDVRMTVPRGWVVGATGIEQSRTDNADGTTTHRYVQDDVHDFTWTTSPGLRRASADGSSMPGLPPVDMRLLMQPEHAGQEDRHFAATAAALALLRRVVRRRIPTATSRSSIPAYQSGAGGMEYPTLFTAGTRWLAPRQTNSPGSGHRSRSRSPVLVRHRRQQRVRTRVDGRRPEHVLRGARAVDRLSAQLPRRAVLWRIRPVAVPRHRR